MFSAGFCRHLPFWVFDSFVHLSARASGLSQEIRLLAEPVSYLSFQIKLAAACFSRNIFEQQNSSKPNVPVKNRSGTTRLDEPWSGL